MKVLFLKCLFFLRLISCLPTFGQSISNLGFEAIGKTIQISYDLSGEKDDLYAVTVYVSQDEGKWEGPLRFVSGDVGENVKFGSNKQIVWEVLKEKEKISGNLRFKLEIIVFKRCRPFTITHTAGSVAPVTKTVTYGVVETDLSGRKKCWITQNLGADRQALSASDVSEASAGWYWQFSRKQGFKHDSRFRTPSYAWDRVINGNNDWLTNNDPCTLLLGSSWRMPTRTEWETTGQRGKWKKGNDPYTSELKLHAAGRLDLSDGTLHGRGNSGYYWTSSQSKSENGWYFYLTFYNNKTGMGSYGISSGFCLRCISD